MGLQNSPKKVVIPDCGVEIRDPLLIVSLRAYRSNLSGLVRRFLISFEMTFYFQIKNRPSFRFRKSGRPVVFGRTTLVHYSPLELAGLPALLVEMIHVAPLHTDNLAEVCILSNDLVASAIITHPIFVQEDKSVVRKVIGIADCLTLAGL